MDETEAEAVLLALEAQLAWRYATAGRTDLVISTPEGKVYYIGPTKHLFETRPCWDKSLKAKMLHLPRVLLRVVTLTYEDVRWVSHRSYTTYTKSNRKRGYKFYKSHAEAKAACERHHATRHWGETLDEVAEAQAVFLAFGPRLPWTSSRNSKHEKAYVASGGYVALSVRSWFSRRVQASFCAGPPYKAETTTTHPRLYKHDSEAKLACERHHATGKWK